MKSLLEVSGKCLPARGKFNMAEPVCAHIAGKMVFLFSFLIPGRGSPAGFFSSSVLRKEASRLRVAVKIKSRTIKRRNGLVMNDRFKGSEHRLFFAPPIHLY